MLVDSHCHLDAGAFDADRPEVLARARAAGVAAQILPAVDAAGWPALRNLCVDAEDLHPAYGLHPMFLHQHRREHVQALGDWLQRERGRVVAVGECGLDYFADGLDRDLQQHYFDAQIVLAREHALPLIVHARHAVDAVIQALRRVGQVRGVIHSFSGSPEQARQLWDMGFLLGLGGPVTYERAQRLRRLAASMPLEFLLLETDAPDQPDAGIRGQRNEPARVADVCQAIAALRGQAPEDIARQTADNAARLFGISLR